MIYITGDTHGDFSRFICGNFPQQLSLTKSDYVIVCGDFGGVWDNSKRERHHLDWVESLPFTLLFCDGNHENFDRLRKYPVELWNGGKIHRIRPHIIHLMRGQVYSLEGKTFFVMGGASSHDIDGGILNPWSDDFEEQKFCLRSLGIPFRVNHRSWWKEELPTDEEYDEAIQNLKRVNNKVNCIITHCAPGSVEELIVNENVTHDSLNDFFDGIINLIQYDDWYFGHYHEDKSIGKKFHLIYQEIIRYS